MKILITCFRLDLTGSSWYTYTLVQELVKQGHEITIFSSFPQELKNPLEKLGVMVTRKVKDLCHLQIEVIIAQHNFLALLVRGVFPKVPMVYVCHGVLHFLETPPSLDLGISQYIAISEEVSTFLLTQGISKNKINVLGNPIDLSVSSNLSPISTFPKNTLYIASQKTPESHIEMVRTVCNRLGSRLEVIGKESRCPDVKDYIQKADLVITIGRGVLESMAYGRAVLVGDYAKLDGLLTHENYEEIKRSNFSGRCFQLEFSEEVLFSQVEKYQQGMGEWNRQIVERDFDAVMVAEVYEKILKKIVKYSISFEQKTLPNKELVWMYENFIQELPIGGWKEKIGRVVKKILGLK